MGFSYELHHSAKKNSYSSPRLVVDRMEELIVELLLVENVWCQKQSWPFMNLLCSGMVGFGLRRNLGTARKEHPSPPLPPPKVGEVLAFYIIRTASIRFLLLSLMLRASTCQLGSQSSFLSCALKAANICTSSIWLSFHLFLTLYGFL